MRKDLDDSKMLGVLGIRRVVGIIAVTLVLCFVVSLVRKAVEAYELRQWIQHLKAEVVELEQERAELLIEIQRRESSTWMDQVLREAGRLPPGVSRVYLVTTEAETATTMSTPTPTPQPLSEQPRDTGLFEGENWEAWMRALQAR